MRPDATTFHIEDGEGNRLMDIGASSRTEASRTFVQFLNGITSPRNSYRLIESTTTVEVEYAR